MKEIKKLGFYLTEMKISSRPLLKLEKNLMSYQLGTSCRVQHCKCENVCDL